MMDTSWSGATLAELKAAITIQNQNQLERADLLAIIMELILRVERLTS